MVGRELGREQDKHLGMKHLSVQWCSGLSFGFSTKRTERGGR